MPTPRMLITWSFGPVGAAAAMPALRAGGTALDAAVDAASAIEADPAIDSVGVGGLPDAAGDVSLDACVMTDPDRCGAVMFLRDFAEPTRLARAVMEHTIHVTLAGAGAEAFAEARGFRRTPLLTAEARRVYERWRDDPRGIDRDKYRGWLPPINVEELRGIDTGARLRTGEAPHDTVSILALDAAGALAGACSTSGMAFKVPGRVGDSPIVGQGLYVDQQAGAAAATGTGEIISGVCGSFLVVELLRRGATPIDAVAETLGRIRRRFRLLPDHQVAFIAMNPAGEWASGALRPGFRHTIADEAGARVEDPTMVLLDE